MLIYKVTEEQLRKAAEGVCVIEAERMGVTNRATGFRVKCLPLKPADDPHFFQRRNRTGDRWVHALCWHGFEAFFKALFDINPEAKAITMMATYDGRDGFLENYPKTADFELGSRMFPCPAADACLCER